MAKGYWIARVDITNAEGFKRDYTAFLAPVLKKFGGRFLVRGTASESPEGTARKFNVIVEFPDHASATACYKSPEYQELVAIRQRNAETDLLIIDGFDGPQP